MKKIICVFITLTFLSASPSFAFFKKAKKSRVERVDAYLNEFSSGVFKNNLPNIYQALTNALTKLPGEVFDAVTRRERPLLFVNSHTTGIARFATATEFVFEKGDRPAFQDGFYLIILGDELNSADDIEAIEGVILHEIAHRYLEHLKVKKFSCELEVEANRLVKSWGYEQEFDKASSVFGSKKKGDSPCQDYLKDKRDAAPSM